MLNSSTLLAIAVVAYLQALWQDANGRRRDEEGKKPRSRAGYARLLSKHLGFPHLNVPLLLLVRYYDHETNVVR